MALTPRLTHTSLQLIRERDEAVDASAKSDTSLGRAQAEWVVKREALEAKVADLQQQLAQAEQRVRSSNDKCAALAGA